MAGLSQAAPKEFSFRTTVALKAEGLEFKVFNLAKAQILPPPTVYHYTDHNGQQSGRYLPRELWYASQYRGRWINPSGQVLVLALIDKALPGDFTERHVLRKDYDAALGSSPDPASDDDAMLAWCRDFAGAEVKDKPRPLPDSFRLQKVLAMEFAGRPPSRVGYVFSLKSDATRGNKKRRFFALFEWQDDFSPADAMRAIERDFLNSIEPLDAPGSVTAAASTRMQNKALTNKVERSAEFLQSRENAINSIKGMKGWWFVETANYVLVSDLPMSQKPFVKQLQSDLEGAHAAYAQFVPPKGALEAVSVVRIFDKADAYNRYVGPDHAWTAGVWMPGKNELVIKPAVWGDSNTRQEILSGMVCHEAFHQYLFYAFDKIIVPAWYNEGHAVFCEGIQITKKGIEVGEVQGCRQVLETLIARKTIPLRDLFLMSYESFYAQDGMAGRQEHYALAWGLVYYLRRGAPLEKDHTYDRLLGNFEETLFQTRNPEEATRKMLEALDMDKFTADFCDFWKSEPQRQAARRNTIFKNADTGLSP